MIGIKSGTKTWSTAEQQSSLKSDGRQTISAADKEAALGDQNIGDYLNKIADPNWVDPSKVRKVGNNELDKDAFLKLFLAQLKNQDPTNTMDSHELAAQLAQFSTLEKLGSIDDGIGNLSKKTGSQGQYEILSLVGKKVTTDSTKVLRGDMKETHDVTFNLAADADIAELSIRNMNGQEVKKLEARGLKAGPNKINWDGLLDNKTPAEEGEYNIVINAKNKAGQKVATESRSEGIVSGVSFTGQGPILKVGNQNIKMSDVKSITDPAVEMLSNAQAASQTQSPQSVKTLKAATSTPTKIAGMAGNLDSVGMQAGLVSKIEKEAEKTAQQGGSKE